MRDTRVLDFDRRLGVGIGERRGFATFGLRAFDHRVHLAKLLRSSHLFPRRCISQLEVDMHQDSCKCLQGVESKISRRSIDHDSRFRATNLWHGRVKLGQ